MRNRWERIHTVIKCIIHIDISAGLKAYWLLVPFLDCFYYKLYKVDEFSSQWNNYLLFLYIYRKHQTRSCPFKFDNLEKLNLLVSIKKKQIYGAKNAREIIVEGFLCEKLCDIFTRFRFARNKAVFIGFIRAYLLGTNWDNLPVFKAQECDFERE